MIKTSKPGRDGTVRVTFALPADEPDGAVSVVGNFNDWNPLAHPLRPRANKTRSAAVTVKAGSTLQFRYLAEGGVWFDDETAAPHEGRDVSLTVLSGSARADARPGSADSRPAAASHAGCGPTRRCCSRTARSWRRNRGMSGPRGRH